MKQAIMRPDPDRVFPGKYVFGEPVPADVYIDGQKVEAPYTGIAIGKPMFPDEQGKTLAVAIGDYFKESGEKK